MEVPIISEELLKAYSPITGDTVITEFVPYIQIIQAIYIEPVLGSELLDELMMQVKDNNLSPENSALILKLAPALAYYTVYQGLPFHWAAIVNKGLTVRESENSKGVAIDDLAQLRRWVRNDAETFLKIAIKYLCKCKDRYPLWNPDKDYCNTGCGCNGLNSSNKFDGGIFFKR